MIVKRSLIIGIAFMSVFWIGLLGHGQDLDIPGLEPLDKPQPAAATSGEVSKGSVNLLDMIKAGGWSMWILGSFSLVVIGLLVFSLIDLTKRNFAPTSITEGLKSDMESLNLEGAMNKVNSDDSCVARMLSAGYEHISEFGYESLTSDDLKEKMSAAAKKHSRSRVRTINYFSVIAQAAPMMGLLGTVSGMIGAFAKLSSGGTGDPSVFAGSISEALITTASGLVVALPAIFCYFIFKDRLQSLVALADETSDDILKILRRSVTQNQVQG